MSPSLSQAGCRNSNVSVGIDLAKLKVSPSVVSIAVGDTISFRNVARGSALSSIGVFLKMHQLSDPGNLDSDRAMVWEVDFLPPGDPLEWRATSTGEYHFESESYPFLRGYITVREPPALPFRQQLIADITTVQPKSQQGEPLVKPQGSPAVGYGALKATEVTSTAAEGSGDVSVCARPDVGASELTIDDIPYEPLKGGPDLAESTGHLLKQFEEIEEHSFRPATKWAPPPRKMQPMAMNLVEVDIDSHAVIGNKVFHSFESLPGPSRHPSEADSHSLRMLSEDDNPPSASSSHGRSAPKLKCSCGKEFSSSLNLKRCQTLHLVHEQSEGVGVGERGGARKAKGGSKKKEAEQSALHSQRLLDLKDFWKQTMHIDQRAKVLSLEGSEQHRKMSSSILLVSLPDFLYLTS